MFRCSYFLSLDVLLRKYICQQNAVFLKSAIRTISVSVSGRFLIVSSDSFGRHVLGAPPHQRKGRCVNIPNVMNSLPSSQFSCVGHNCHMIIKPEHVRITRAQNTAVFYTYEIQSGQERGNFEKSLLTE